MVAAVGLAAQTVAAWQGKAGQHARRVHATRVCQGQGEVGQGQADALYVKPQDGPGWIATAMRGFSRLFLWGPMAAKCDARLMTQVIQHVRAAAQSGRPILCAVEGLGAYPQALLKVWRDAGDTGWRGRPRLMP